MGKISKPLVRIFISSGAICLAFLLFQAIYPLDLNAATKVCAGGNCWTVACFSNSECGTNKFTGRKMCQGNSVWQSYITYVCDNPGTADANCNNFTTQRHQISCESDQACVNGACVQSVPTPGTSTGTSGAYVFHQYKRCAGNALYWYDSYNRQQDLYQVCSFNQTCSNDKCTTVYTAYARKGCYNNSVYWYDSEGRLKSLYQTCNPINQACQEGACVTTTPYVKNYRTNCYNNDVYWYNSRGIVENVYKNCSDDNPCTLDICQDNACSNKLKCDGSTCAVNSEDYIKYCGRNDQVQGKNLIISIFGKKESEPLQWQKTVSAVVDDKIDFLITAKNISGSEIDNVFIKASTNDNILYTDNLKIDNSSSNENIFSGVNIGTIAQNSSKAITFTGTVKSQNPIEIIGVVTSSNTLSDLDSFTINSVPAKDQDISQNQVNPATASIVGNPAINFFKKWYVWGIAIVVIGILFFVIFRRLSAEA